MITVKRKARKRDVNTGTQPKRKKVVKQTISSFEKHFGWNADADFIERLQSKFCLSKKEVIQILPFEEEYRCAASWRTSDKIDFGECEAVSHHQLGVLPKLCGTYESMMLKQNDPKRASLSNDLYHIIGRYMDLAFVSKDNFYTELFCLHALNHVMLTRNLIINNKQVLENAKEEGKISDEKIEKCRDQGLTRPKVLILCPFRKHAYDIVHMFVKLMFGDNGSPLVSNFTKFKEEFRDEENRVHEKRKVAQDYKDLMSGNIDDCFRIGIGLAKKCLKLYTKFEESDILLCSPVGLRIIIGDDEVGSKRQFDVLSSIELLIIDKAHILFMQNWEHLFNIFETLNVVPSKIATDISRVRHWALNDLSRYYRQTLIFSEINFVELHALMSRYCQNYAGEFSILSKQQSTLSQLNDFKTNKKNLSLQPESYSMCVMPRMSDKVIATCIEVPIMQGMYRFDAKDAQTQSDDRFNFFIANILPKCDVHTLIFVPSYFDFVRLRNHLKKENENFAQVHEYAKRGKVAKARDMFFKGQRKLMLLTERFYFYFRYHIKGIKSIVFYQLPMNPHFYTELINFIRPLRGENVENFKAQTKVLYSQFDIIRLQNVFGNAKRFIKSDEQFFALIGE